MSTAEVGGESDSEGDEGESVTPGPSSMSSDPKTLETTPDVQEPQNTETTSNG